MSAVSELASDPLMYVAATIFLHTLSTVIAKLKPTKEINNGYHEQLKSMHNALKESIAVTREVAKTVTSIASAQVESDEIEEVVVRELEKLTDLIRDLSDLHKDPTSKFATVDVVKKEEEIIRMLNDIKLTLARM